MDYSSGKYLKLSELIQNDTDLIYHVPTINALNDGNDSTYVFEASKAKIVNDDITANGAELTHLTLAHNVEGVSPSSSNIFYGVCTSPTGTAAKTVTIETPRTGANMPNILSIGTILFITFTYTNSVSVGSITLNVNGLGAKGIRKIKNKAIDTLAAAGELIGGCTYMFTYNGSYWVCMTLDYNTTYSNIPSVSASGGATTQYYLMGTPSTIGTTLYRYGTTGPYMLGNQLYAGSDLAYKKDINPISGAFVDELFSRDDITYDFTWKDSNSNSSGFIAQWIEDIMPEVVNGEDGEKHVNYDAALSKVVGAIFKKIQEQQNQIDELIKQNKEIKQELENIRNISEK